MRQQQHDPQPQRPKWTERNEAAIGTSSQKSYADLRMAIATLPAGEFEEYIAGAKATAANLDLNTNGELAYQFRWHREEISAAILKEIAILETLHKTAMRRNFKPKVRFLGGRLKPAEGYWRGDTSVSEPELEVVDDDYEIEDTDAKKAEAFRKAAMLE